MDIKNHSTSWWWICELTFTASDEMFLIPLSWNTAVDGPIGRYIINTFNNRGLLTWWLTDFILYFSRSSSSGGPDADSVCWRWIQASYHHTALTAGHTHRLCLSLCCSAHSLIGYGVVSNESSTLCQWYRTPTDVHMCTVEPLSGDIRWWGWSWKKA